MTEFGICKTNITEVEATPPAYWAFVNMWMNLPDLLKVESYLIVSAAFTALRTPLLSGANFLRGWFASRYIVVDLSA